MKPDYIYRDNKPVAAIIDIAVFEEILDKLEDVEDIEFLKESRKSILDYRNINDYLKERENV